MARRFLGGPGSLAMGVSVAFLSEPIYRVTVVLVPATADEASGSLAALAGQVWRTASLVGMSGSVGQQRDAAVAVLKSRSLFDQFFAGNSLLPVLFEDKWDAARKDWKLSLSKDDVPSLDDG